VEYVRCDVGERPPFAFADPPCERDSRAGVSRQSVHAWVRRYEQGGLGALPDRPKRPDTCPHHTSAQVEAAVCEMRREHPKWGPLRLAHELGNAGVVPAPSRMSVYRMLVRHGLAGPGPRKRPKDSYLRWERDEPMALWQLAIVGGAFLAWTCGGPTARAAVTHWRRTPSLSGVRGQQGREACDEAGQDGHLGAGGRKADGPSEQEAGRAAG
jgi:transposase